MCNLQTRYAMHKASVPIVWCMRSVQLNGNESHSDSVATSLRVEKFRTNTKKSHQNGNVRPRITYTHWMHIWVKMSSYIPLQSTLAYSLSFVCSWSICFCYCYSFGFWYSVFDALKTKEAAAATIIAAAFYSVSSFVRSFFFSHKIIFMYRMRLYIVQAHYPSTTKSCNAQDNITNKLHTRTYSVNVNAKALACLLRF